MSIQDGIRDFILSDLGWTGSEPLTDDMPLIENRVIDSLGIFQVVTHLEHRYGVEIADEDLVPENFETIGAITKLVQAKTQP